MTLQKLLRLFIFKSIALLTPFLAYSQDGSFRMEAEEMTRTGGYVLDFADFASAKRFVGINAEIATTGTVTKPFVGATNDYFIKVGYFDENDGEAPMELWIGGVKIDEWTFDDDTENPFVSVRTFRERTINTTQLNIEKGATIELRGNIDNNELARLDYIEFTPVDGFNGLPEVEIISPLSESVFNTPATIYLRANATDADNDGIERIVYFEGDNKIGESIEAPFNIEWENNVPGTYFITARAFDIAGASTVSEPIGVTVRDANSSGCEAVYVEEDGYLLLDAESGEFENGDLADWIISSDTAGFSGSGYIEWTGTNNFNSPGNGTINYKFKINTPGTYELRWRSKINIIDLSPDVNPRAEHNDTHVRFPDAQVFANLEGGLLYPAGGFGVPADADLIKDSRAGWFKVFSGNTIGQWGWDTRTNDSNAFVFVNFKSPGVYTLQLSSRSAGHALDRITLANVNLQSNPIFNTSLDESLCDPNNINQYPEVSITSPQNRRTFANQANIDIAASASDSDGNVSKVEFYNGNTLISTDNNAPYQANITGLSDTTLYLTAKAIDNDGSATSSSMIVAAIGNNNLPNLPPNVVMAAPEDEVEIAVGEQIVMVANAEDSDGSIKKVSFFEGIRFIGENPNGNNGEFAFFFKRDEPGAYVISAKAEDNEGSISESDPITINVISPNIFPTASISAPQFNAVFTGGEAIEIEADVADEDGTIEKVIFYADGDVIGEVASSPFNYSWTPANSGEYELTIEAFDNSGDSKLSEPITVIINNPPTVSIETPENNQLFNEGENITLEVSVSDGEGSVVKVEYYNNDELLATVNEVPFSYTINQAQAGDFSISAKAYDDYDAVGTSNPISFTVNALPQISITSPANNSIISFGEPIDFTVNASDQDGTIEKVIYYNEDVQIAEITSAPFNFNWIDAPAGTYSIKAIAFDNNNASNISDEVVLIVNKAPSVMLIRPQPEDSFEVGRVITIEASAEDEDGTIEKVEFILDGEKIGEDRTSPYIFNMPGLELGTYELIVNAIDNQGTISSTEPFSIVLSNLPIIKITSPESGTSFEVGETINFEVEASDQDGEVVKVEYYSNNLLIGTSETTPFSFAWTDASTGMKEITAHAYDNNNGKSVSEKITINVSLNVPPTVSITNLTGGAVYQEASNIEISVSAVDTDGTISKVEFYANDNLIGETSTMPYTLNWDSPMPNSYTLKAKAIDDKNAAAFSDEVEIKVNAAPQVSISNPSNGEVYISGSTVNLLAAANDTDGSISKIEFLINGNKIGESLAPPFTIDWNKPEAGIYEVSALATDSDGGTSESEKIKVFIQDANAVAARLVSLTSDTVVAPQAIIPLQAVVEKGFEVSKIAFYVNGVVEMEDTESPFEMNLQVGDEGTYEVKVKAYYQDNGIFESDITTITVSSALSLEKGFNSDLDMLVYPNPVTHSAQLRFNMDNPQTVMVSITDIVGNNVVQESSMSTVSGENTFQFSLENLPKGIYLLHIKAGEKRYVNKVMKQ